MAGYKWPTYVDENQFVRPFVPEECSVKAGDNYVNFELLEVNSQLASMRRLFHHYRHVEEDIGLADDIGHCIVALEKVQLRLSKQTNRT